eukprot:m51a1_g8478 hypothetical protein (146) ;mRNA; f:507851-513187
MAGLTWLTFTQTRRNASAAAGSGIAGLRIVRPGYGVGDVFTAEFVEAASKFGVIRSMDNTNTNLNPTSEWSHRSLMTWPGFGGAGGSIAGPWAYIKDGTHYLRGAQWERLVLMANAANTSLWINVPCLASDDYVAKLASLLLYGI